MRGAKREDAVLSMTLSSTKYRAYIYEIRMRLFPFHLSARIYTCALSLAQVYSLSHILYIYSRAHRLKTPLSYISARRRRQICAPYLALSCYIIIPSRVAHKLLMSEFCFYARACKEALQISRAPPPSYTILHIIFQAKEFIKSYKQK